MTIVRVLMVLVAMCAPAWAQIPSVVYQKGTIGSLLRSSKNADGKLIELQGSLTTGFETSVFRDGSRCGSGSDAPECTLWLRIGECKVVGEVSAGLKCQQLISRLSQEGLPGVDDLRLITVRNIVVRGRLSTIRKDITYDKSVPRSARIGFGHLGAYAAEIEAREIEVRP